MRHQPRSARFGADTNHITLVEGEPGDQFLVTYGPMSANSIMVNWPRPCRVCVEGWLDEDHLLRDAEVFGTADPLFMEAIAVEVGSPGFAVHSSGRPSRS